MTRTACLLVPLFPLAARLRSEPELAPQPLALLEGDGPRARVVAATRPARLAGVHPGLALAQARARLPQLIARARDNACENAAQEALLDVAESLSPRVEDGGEGIAYLDATGLERHYPGEEPEVALGHTILVEVGRRAGMPVRVGIAASKLAARVAASGPGSPQVVAAGGEAAFLAPLPLARLTPEADALALLGRWGIRSIGELARLPRDEVASRLGAAGRELHAIARGLDPRPLTPRRPPAVFREGMELEWPLAMLEPFLFIARAALERLVRRMQGHALGCARLELSLALENGGRHERALTLPSPTRDVKTLLTLLRLDLEAHPAGAPLVGFTLAVHPDRPRVAQLTLFGPEALAPDRLATTVARLFALLGEGRVGSPQTVDGHRPERFALRRFTPPPPPRERRDPLPVRGLLTLRVLRPPVALEVLSEGRGAAGEDLSGARPLSVSTPTSEAAARRPRIGGEVRVASGPWRLEERWWSATPVAREYWDVELAGAGLYRIYRDPGSGEWYADGVYD